MQIIKELLQSIRKGEKQKRNVQISNTQEKCTWKLAFERTLTLTNKKGPVN